MTENTAPASPPAETAPAATGVPAEVPCVACNGGGLNAEQTRCVTCQGRGLVAAPAPVVEGDQKLTDDLNPGQQNGDGAPVASTEPVIVTTDLTTEPSTQPQGSDAQ